jgi:hypothetical protein
VLAATSPVNVPDIAPLNSVSDITGDATYEAGGTISASMPNLDLVGSSIRKLTTAPCSDAAPCYEVVMQVNNLSFAPDLANDPDLDLVWLTQWFVPSTSDPHGGKNFFVFAESTAGGALQCYSGENHAARNSDWFVLTYPPNGAALPPANCTAVTGPNGSITIDVPMSILSEADPIDNKLHEVTASTMTLSAPASANPLVGSYGGSLFNVIDVAQPYIFAPTLNLDIISVFRLADNQIAISGHGVPFSAVNIEASADLLTSFATIGTATVNGVGVFEYDDAGAATLPKRFYRATYP